MLIKKTRLPWLFRMCFSVALLSTPPLLADEVDWGAIAESRANDAGEGLIGKPLKPYVLNSIEGEPVDLAKYLGRKPIYLKFWATWCTTCLAQMPHFEKVAKQYKDDIAVIAVNTGINDELEDVQAYLAQNKLNMPVVRDDGSLANDLQLTVTPQHVLIDHTGQIVWLGHKDDERFMTVLDQVAKRSYQANIKPLPKVHKPKISLDGQRLESAPKFIATNGQSVAIHDKKRATYLWFTSPWCEWYLAENKPKTATACKAVRNLATATRQLAWLGISIDVWADKGQVEGFTKNHQLTMPFILDDDKLLFSAFNVRDIPAVVIIQPDGSFEKFGFASEAEVERFRKQHEF